MPLKQSMKQVTALAAAIGLSIPAAALAGQGLFMQGVDEVASKSDVPATIAQPWFESPQAVALDPAQLQGKAHQLILPNGKSLHARTGELETRGDRSFSWRGHLYSGDHAVGSATYTVNDGRVTGRIRVKGQRYVLRSDGQGGHWLGSQDESHLPAPHPEHGPLTPADSSTPSSERLAQREAQSDGQGDDAPVIDVLLIYTQQAIDDAGGEMAIRDAMRSAADVTNTGFFNSENEARIRVVGVHPTDVEEPADGSQNLGELRDDPIISALRQRYSADLIAAAGNYDGWCGIAFAPGSEFQFNPGSGISLTNSRPDFGCLQNVTMAHEIGHNMGLHHDPVNGPSPGNAIQPYAFGHFVDQEFRTIMSYWTECTDGNSWNCPSVDHFSDPDVIPSGESSPSGVEDERHNSRVIDQTDSWVAAYFEADHELIEVFEVEGDVTPSGDAIWRARSQDEDSVAAFSGALAGGEASEVEVTVEGPNVFGFEWMLPEGVNDRHLRVIHQGDTLFDSNGQANGEWNAGSFEVEETGETTVRFVYEADSGAPFEDIEVAVRDFVGDQVVLAGELHNVHGNPVADVEVTALGPDGDVVSSILSGGDGQFSLGMPAPLVDEHDDLTIQFNGPGVVMQEAAVNDCLEEDGGCSLELSGEARLISGTVSGMLSGESASLILANSEDGSADLTQEVSSDANGDGDFSFEVDALVEYGAVSIDARGYDAAATDSAGNPREADIDGLNASLDPTAPHMDFIGKAGASTQQIELEISLDTRDRDVTVIVDYGEQAEEGDTELDQTTSTTVSRSDAGAETITVNLTGLDCETGYEWQARAVNDHDLEDTASAMTGSTDACPADDGGSSGCTLGSDSGRPDPLFWAMFLMAALWTATRLRRARD